MPAPTVTIPPFDLQVGENVFPPVSPNKDFDSADGSFDITNMPAYDPVNPGAYSFDFYVEWADDKVNGPWTVLWHDQSIGRGRDKQGNLATLFRFGLSFGAIYTSQTNLRVRIVTSSAWASSGGAIDLVRRA